MRVRWRAGPRILAILNPSDGRASTNSATVPASPAVLISRVTFSVGRAPTCAMARIAKAPAIPNSGVEKLGPTLPESRYAVILTSAAESVESKRASIETMELIDEVCSSLSNKVASSVNGVILMSFVASLSSLALGAYAQIGEPHWISCAPDPICRFSETVSNLTAARAN